MPAPTGTSSQPATDWNAHLGELDGHFLQSWEWGQFKHSFGWIPHRILIEHDAGTAMAQVLYRAKGPVSVGYVPRGPAFSGDAEQLWPLLLGEFREGARKRRAIMTLVEPNEASALTVVPGLTPVPGHIQPGRTVKIPLAGDDEILAHMHQKTRYNVNLAKRRGVGIEQRGLDSIDLFYELMKDTASRNEFDIHERDYYENFLAVFGDRAIMLFARVDDDAIGAVLIAARFGREAVYMYGASSSQHRAHGAAFLLQYEAMRWARDHGCATYDLWGIPDQDPEPAANASQSGEIRTKGDDWRGLYRFKTGFGGDVVTYLPMLERRHVPILPWIARRLNVIRG